jgi:hypothetical protein
MAAEVPQDEPIVYSNLLRRVECAPMSARETADRRFALVELYRTQNMDQPVTQQEQRVAEILKVGG